MQSDTSKYDGRFSKTFMQILQFSTTGTHLNVLYCGLREITFDIYRNTLGTLPIIELEIILKIQS